MKKLIIATAMVASAIIANAASVAWTSASNFCDAEGNVLTAATAPAGSIVLVYLGSGTADWDSATVVNTGTIKYTVSMGSTKAIVSGSFTLDPATYANGDIFGVMFKDDSGNLSKLQYVAGGDVDTTYTVTGFSDVTSTLAGYSFASAAYTAAVPEPTSALLLVLGMAGLALRRKRA